MDVIQLEMNKVIVGQKHMIESLLIGLLSNGHILLEGVPGLARTLAIKTLSDVIDARFNRIQFTPDLLPADLIGTLVYSQKKRSSRYEKGLSSLTSSWLTRLTVPRRKSKVPYSKPCKNDKYPLEVRLFYSTNHSW